MTRAMRRPRGARLEAAAARAAWPAGAQFNGSMT